MEDKYLRRVESQKKLQDMCRMCASQCEKSVQIFGPEGLATELPTKIENHLPIKVSESDSLPCQLCYECTNILIQWDAAVLGSVAAEKKLQALQWQEQQSQLSREKKIDKFENKELSVSASTTGESLCCSVCQKSGMNFRQLVNHLKTHDSLCSRTKEDRDVVDEETSKSKSNSDFEAHNHSHELRQGGSKLSDLQSVVSLGPVKKMELRSKSKVSETVSDASKSDSGLKTNHDEDRRPRLRKRRGKSPSYSDEKSPSKVTEESSGDPLVTSSTSTSSFKSVSGEDNPCLPENGSPSGTIKEMARDRSPSESQDRALSFKPKVRIISAESINHTLEQRAKANQSSKVLETQKSFCSLTTRRPVVPILPKPNMETSTVVPKTRIIMSSGVVKEIKMDGSQTSPKYLKLADGRIIRLLGGSSAGLPLKGTGTQSVLKSSSVFRPILRSIVPAVPGEMRKLVMSESQKLASSSLNESVKNNSSTEPTNEVKVLLRSSMNVKPQSLLSENSTQSATTSNVSTRSTSSDSSPQERKVSQPPPPLKVNVKVGDSTQVVFDLQPGPKNSAQRYKCSVCGKRNFAYDSLQDHAQSHILCKMESEKGSPSNE